MSKTHRCPDCLQEVEAEEKDMCPSCGRCVEHCKSDTHRPMRRIGDA